MPRDRYEDDDYEEDDYDEAESYDDDRGDDHEEEEELRGRDRVRAEAASRKGGLSDRLGFKPTRPGEQDIVRSPVVLILGGVAAVLALLGAIYGFMIIREGASREYEAAVGEMDRGSYSTAIGMFDKFLATHAADHELVPSVKLLRGKCRIQQQVNGATPDWTEGLKATQDFIAENRDLEDYDEHKDEIRGYAEKICRGAAEQAVAQKRGNLLTIAPGLLQVSQEALAIVNRLSPAEEKPETLIVDVTALKERGEALILRQEVFASHVAEINSALDEDRPIDALEARRRLLERYSEFSNDRELVALMQKMLVAEKSLLTVEDVSRDAKTEAIVPEDLSSLTLTVRTQARTDEVPTGRIVLVLAKQCLYGVDMSTGDPIWRQVVGLNLPFFPMAVSASVPGLLSYNPETGELLMIEQSSGRLIWRQTIGEVVTAKPVVQEGQIYLVTQSQHLYKINLESGKVTRRLRFSQPILSAPSLMEGLLVIGGEFAVMYTVDPRSLECLEVSYIGHGAGEIRAPMLPMGKLLLMAENTQSEKCRLRVLRWDSDKKSFTQVVFPNDDDGNEMYPRVPGQVLDPMVLRGNQLLVASTGRNISAFTISDDPANDPIVAIGATQVEGSYAGPIYMDSGPDGQVWMATDSLRKLEVKQRTVNLDPESTAEGISTQPLQRIGESLYMARRQIFTYASFLSKIDRTSLTGFWRTVVGGEVKVLIPRDNGTAVCVTETGHVFRITERELAPTDGGDASATFMIEPSLTLKLPDGMDRGLFATPLPNSKTAVCAGGEDSRIWILSATGQLERQVRVSEALEVAPEPMERGLIAAVPGKLRLVGRPSGSARVQDFIAPVEQGTELHWNHVLTLGEDQALALDNQQRLFRIQYRKTPVSHLAAVSTLTLDSPVDARPAIDQNRIFMADAAGNLTVMDAESFETVATTALGGPATNAVWVDGATVFVEIGSAKLMALNLNDGLKPLWSLDLAGGGLSGAPTRVGEQYIVSERTGRVSTLNAASGAVEGTLELNQPLNGSVIQIGSRMFAMTLDGTMYRLSSKAPSN